jgi:hypothetical protein
MEQRVLMTDLERGFVVMDVKGLGTLENEWRMYVRYTSCL